MLQQCIAILWKWHCLICTFVWEDDCQHEWIATSTKAWFHSFGIFYRILKWKKNENQCKHNWKHLEMAVINLVTVIIVRIFSICSLDLFSEKSLVFYTFECHIISHFVKLCIAYECLIALPVRVQRDESIKLKEGDGIWNQESENLRLWERNTQNLSLMERKKQTDRN